MLFRSTYTRDSLKTIAQKDTALAKKGSEIIDSKKVESQLEIGDKVVFFAEKERKGVWNGTFIVEDGTNNPWGILGILGSTDGYIKNQSKIDAELKSLREAPLPEVKEEPSLPRVDFKEWMDFKNEGIVTPERLNDIAIKIKINEPLFEEEQLMYDAKKGEIDDIIAKPKEAPLPETKEEVITEGEVVPEEKPIEEVTKIVEEGNDLVLSHGTKHDFDKFQLEKIGTGEGAQAFGYGLYFTDGSKIAEIGRAHV